MNNTESIITKINNDFSLNHKDDRKNISSKTSKFNIDSTDAFYNINLNSIDNYKF